MNARRSFSIALLLWAVALPAAARADDPPKAGASARAPEFVPSALWDGRKLAPFRALDDPPMVAAKDATFLADGDYVLGVTLNGESSAYPTRFIWWHHVINDRIGKEAAGGAVPLAVTYCSVCNTGIAYDRRLDGTPRQLEFFGLYNGVVALCDRETGSALPQVDGRFVAGPLAGKSLKALPILLDTTWGEWKRLHPNTMVMSPETEYKRYYRPREQPEPRDYQRFPAPFFQPTWAWATAIAGVVLLLSLLGWWGFVRMSSPAGPSKAVHPGMYDLRQELQKNRPRQQPAGAAQGF